MRPRSLMLTTALAALVAAPVAAQETGSAQAEQGGEQIGAYTVGELTRMPLVTSDGTEAGRVEAVIEGQDGLHVLANLEDRQVAIPLQNLSLSDNGGELMLGMSMDDLDRMAAYEGDGQTRLGQDVEIAQAMGEGGQAGSGDSAEMEEMETTVVEGTDDDVTVVTTAPSAVDPAETGAADGQQTRDMAQGDTGQTGQMDGEETDMAQGGTSQAGDQETDMAEGDTGQTGGASSGARNDISHFAEMTVGQILGMEVSGTDGSDVGEIDYVYRNADGYMAVIGIGGFLGLGEHTVALPLGDFSINETGDGLVVDGMTEADLEAMPEIDESGLQSLPDDHVIDA